jgi:glycosyltransferase involved in cell wall biosynthesis
LSVSAHTARERIAVLSSSYPREPGDASGHFVASEAHALQRAGHEVHVIAPGAGAALVDGVRVHWLSDQGAFGWPGVLPRLREKPERAFGVCAFAFRARGALRDLGPFSRVQAHFLLPSAWPIVSLATTRARACELELIGHGSDVRMFCRLPKHLRQHIAKGWLARGARVRVTSTELAALLCAANPELSDVVRVAASRIDVQGVPRRAEARKRLDLAESSAILLIVARLIPDKRVALALRALELLELEAATTIVIGDGPEAARLRARFPKVRFTGRLSRAETLCFIAAADVLVSASALEGAPTVVREARALGVPVVAVAAGDLAERARADPGILLASP